MSRTLIIGYGNTMRGDDGVGPRAALELQSLLSDTDADVRISHQLTPEYAELLSEFDIAVFIDASADGEAGTLTVTQIDASHIPDRVVSHHIDPESLLACSRALYGNAPVAYLITIAASSFGYMEGLSGPVRDRMGDLLDVVIRIVRSGSVAPVAE
jgi:hydrogenase maturation protease